MSCLGSVRERDSGHIPATLSPQLVIRTLTLAPDMGTGSGLVIYLITGQHGANPFNLLWALTTIKHGCTKPSPEGLV